MSNENKVYIGDGVYAEWKGHDIRLTTENGISVQNEIFMEVDMIVRLHDWMQNMIKSKWGGEQP